MYVNFLKGGNKMTTLEQEFSDQVFIHKSSIVLGSLLKYYTDVANSGITIPEFMDETPEEKAQEHYYKLLANRNKFNETYEQCWNRYKEILP